ncbi:ubiquinol oxidase subunit II [Polymorphobacter megasporae]|uniref:ubiquinol oxidase subunit II n=1 Tax=Glacieibacterium megasporae TaxID=2835787 RepID=UPI001C1E31A4|nr:ubiquinol oxidase subunit II [Polymorphobacter megasporae]UAJ11271.1 ubiquinol oxidase subunit II [Polymorphobacter megasporae]
MDRPQTGSPGAERATAVLRVLAVLAAFGVTGCSSVVLDPKGPVGSAETIILYNALAIMLAIVVPTIVATLVVAWWFRASNTRAKYRPEWVFSGRIELVVWSIPLMVILLLSGVIWSGSHALDPAQPLRSTVKPLEVEVVSLDWKWLFIYPAQGVAAVNDLVVPAGTPVHFRLTSASVMSAFFVPQLGSMIYTMNGMATQLNLMADRPGDFDGRSSHYNGDGFPGMHFKLHAVTPEQFAQWAATAGRGTTVLDAAAYQQLARQSIDNEPLVYARAAPGLFDDIVRQKLPPGPGPKADTASPREEIKHAG